MTRWQRYARLIIGVFAIVFAIGVAVTIKRRQAEPPSPSLVRTDPGAVVESTGGRVERFKVSRENVRVEYDKQLTYADGSTRMMGVTITTDARDGRSFTVKGKEGHVGQNEAAMVLDGDVRLVSSDGMTVTTEHATYTEADSTMRAEGPVEFTRGRLAGSGTGMTYEKTTDLLTILSRAMVHVAAGAKGIGAADITSGTAAFARRDKSVRFGGGVKVDRGGQLTESNSAVGYLSDDEKRFERIELRDHSRITAPKASAGAVQSLTSRDMNLKYRDDGETLESALLLGGAAIQVAGEAGKAGRQIAADTLDVALAADGSTPTAVTGRDAVQLTLPPDPTTPARTIRSNAIDAKGEAGRGLTAAQFAGNVQFRERGADVDRTATAATLDVTMKPGTGALEDARFAHAVRFADGKLAAFSAAARYDLTKGVLELSGSEPGALVPHASNDRIAVDAAHIDITLAGPKLKATGGVKSVIQPPQQGRAAGSHDEAKLPSMLKQNEPVNVTGKAMEYDGTLSKAAYTGGAILWQGDTSIKGDSIVIDDRSGDLSAEGTVTTTTMLDDVDKDKKKTRVRSIGTAKAMQYEETPRRATYTGGAHLSGPQGDLTAATIVLYLKPSGDELERVEASDTVTLRDRNRKTTGQRLTYTTADERYVVGGAPVTIVDECGRETIGKTLTYLKTADTIVVDGNEQTRTQTKGNSQCP